MYTIEQSSENYVYQNSRLKIAYTTIGIFLKRTELSPLILYLVEPVSLAQVDRRVCRCCACAIAECTRITKAEKQFVLF